MERLTTEDLIMLWPDEIWPQEIGALVILEGDALLDPNGRFRIEAARQAIAARLHLVPRFRQLLYVPRNGLGPPLWIDAPNFDLSEHVRVAALPAPGGEAALLQAAEQLRRRRLDRSRPLWEMCFLPGLPGNRIGLFVKMHHTIADGIAGVASMGAFLDAAPDAPLAPAPPWRPQPPPTPRELFADNLWQHAGRLGHALAALTHPVAAARRTRIVWQSMRELLSTPPEPQTSLNRVVGPDRNLALIRGSLDSLKHIARVHRATVNDVLLTVVAGGLRALLSRRGERVDGRTLRIDVPITLRPADARAQARGNLIGQMLVYLPIGLADPGERLERIAAETATRKAQSHPSVGKVLRAKLVRRLVLRLLNRAPVNVTSTDLVGPPTPVYLAGARLLEVFPVLSLMGTVSLGVAALSYAGQFGITAVADKDTYPDLDIFTAGVERDLHHLLGTSAARPAAGRRLSPPRHRPAHQARR